MAAISTPYRLTYPLRACIRWSFIVMGSSLIGILAVNVLADLWRGNTITFQDVYFLLALVGSITLAGTAGLALLLYLHGRVWGAVICDDSLRATTLLGRRVEVPWASISDVRLMHHQGFPALVMRSTATASLLYVYTLGLDVGEVYRRLCETAGPGHPLTAAFAPTARS